MSLRIQGLAYTYPGFPATLRGVDLDVEPGTIAAVLGPSGGGKSTLLQCTCGLLAPEAGRVHLDGEDVTDVPTHRRHIGMLFQEPALFPHLDVAGNVAFGLRYRDLAKDQHGEETDRWLRLVGLQGRAGARIDELSGGQRQRVALARTLAAAPQAVLLDEPLSALDRELRESLGDRIRTLLHEARVAAIWVTHDEEEARRVGDSVWRLVDGVLVPADRPNDAAPA